MNAKFTSTFFKNNRTALKRSGEVVFPIVIAANGLLQRAADSPFTFHQDANFWYLTGITEPDVLLVIDTDKEYLILPQRDHRRDVFDGMMSHESLCNLSGITEIYEYTDGWNKLTDAISTSQTVASIAALPEYIDIYGMYTNPARRYLHQKLKSLRPAIEITDIATQLVGLRMVKQAEELAAISEAIYVTGESIEDALTSDKRQVYRYEYELEAEITKGFRSRGSRGHAFDPIIASGNNATTIHYIANNAKLPKNSLIVMDIGAECNQYAADITRTVALQKPSKRQQEVFDAVLDVQRFAYNLLKPGVLIREYEKQVEGYMGEILRSLKLINSIDSESTRKYYPHATSHHLGLNVHDVADYERPLSENMVLTVEPGIYIPEEAFGVRIEDDVRITSTGIEVLSAALPASLT